MGPVASKRHSRWADGLSRYRGSVLASRPVRRLGLDGRRLGAAVAAVLAAAACVGAAARASGPGATITTVAGTGTGAYSGDGGRATSAALNFTLGVAVDSSGDLFIADAMNNRIRKVDPAGVITTVVGTGSAGYSGDGGSAASAQLKFPADVIVDGGGNLFIADVGNSRVRKVTSASGTITTVAGNGTSGFSGDGGPATLAALTSPAGVDLDSAGELFIADYGANRVRRVSAGEIITTVAGTGSPGYSGDGGPATAAMLK